MSRLLEEQIRRQFLQEVPLGPGGEVGSETLQLKGKNRKNGIAVGMRKRRLKLFK
jgi:hypothetical protein